MESELQSKHLEKKKLKKELRLACIQLKSVLGLFLYNALVLYNALLLRLKPDKKLF